MVRLPLLKNVSVCARLSPPVLDVERARGIRLPPARGRFAVTLPFSLTSHQNIRWRHVQAFRCDGTPRRGIRRGGTRLLHATIPSYTCVVEIAAAPGGVPEGQERVQLDEAVRVGEDVVAWEIYQVSWVAPEVRDQFEQLT